MSTTELNKLKLAQVMYWIAMLINSGVIIISLFIILPDVARDLNLNLIQKYHIGWGYGMALVYTLASLSISILALIILKGNYFHNVAKIFLTSSLLFGLAHVM